MIKCLSINCVFNVSGLCSASVVNIEGFDANITPETYCKTFIDSLNSYKITNSTMDNNETSPKNIICSAYYCTYNFSGSCKSSDIQVNSLNNTCETFKKRSYNNYEY